MEIIEDPLEFQQHMLAERTHQRRIALVPTMGALHAGHLKLIHAARQHAGPQGLVIASIFVNPIQFNSAADLARYPRTLERDAELCADAGVDLIFAPARAAMYPPEFLTSVTVNKMTAVLCGAHRPGHFAGVTTVVMKLLMLAQPHVALFGWKDAQQFLVLRRMVDDLCVPVKLVGIETVRELDGLAMSSRNAYLTPEERAAAPRIFAGLTAAQNLFATGERNAAKLLSAATASIQTEPLIKLEYAELRALDTLETQPTAEPGNSLLAIAAHLGNARLIDNIRP